MARGSLAALLGAATLFVASHRAVALEGEPALLVGAGVEHWRSDMSSTAPLAALGGGYGIGDWVDVRTLATASRLDLCGTAGDTPCGDQTWHLSLGSMLALKLDVIQWVPYAGPVLTYHWLTGGPVTDESHPHDLGVGAALGVDYVPAREYGVGLQASYQGFVGGFADGSFDRGLFTMELHLERRWGW